MSTTTDTRPTGPGDPGDGDDGQQGVLALIAAIQNGTLSGRTMDVRARRACVEHLAAEGFGVVETAGVLRVSERTVARDRSANLEANALRQDPARLGGQTAGRLLREMEAAVARIRRATRPPDTPASVKVDAEHRCWLILADCVARLQSLGYLPTAAQRVDARIAHAQVATPSAADLAAELERLAHIRRDLLPHRPELDRDLNLVRADVAAVAAGERVRRVTEVIEQELHHER